MQRALAAIAGDGRMVFDLELVYGHCWSAGPRNDPAAYRIPANRISRRNPRG
jgi:hypothetical protein